MTLQKTVDPLPVKMEKKEKKNSPLSSTNTKTLNYTNEINNV